MTWLLGLYPPRWRQRYGREVAAMLAERRFSLRIAVDLVAGAIDVWLHPSVTLAAAPAADSHVEEKTMLNRIMRLDCRGAFGPNLAKADQWKASLVMIGCCVVLTAAWMAAHFRFDDNPYVDSLAVMPSMVGMLASMRYTYLKERSNSVQAVFIGGFSLLLCAFFIAAGWIASRL